MDPKTNNDLKACQLKVYLYLWHQEDLPSTIRDENVERNVVVLEANAGIWYSIR